MSLSPYIDFKECKGINNVDNAADLSPFDQKPGDTDFWLTKGINVDITNKKRPKRRVGRTALVAGANYRCLNPFGDPCLFMDDSTMKMLKADLATVATIKTGMSASARIAYEKIVADTWCSDGTTIGYVRREEWNDLPEVTQGYTKAHILNYLRATRKKMPAGHLMCYYNRRLYVAVGDVIWYSDPLKFHRTRAKDGFIHMDGHVTLLKATADGLWVADGHTHFLQGPDARKFTRIEKAPYNAVLHAVAQVPADKIGVDGILEPCFKWASEEGICVGGAGGFFKNLTVDKYDMPEGTIGTALYKDMPGMSQAIFIVRN